MKFEEIDNGFNEKFEEECKCGKTGTVITQKDGDPEYYTDVYLLCECGEYIHFSLPVN